MTFFLRAKFHVLLSLLTFLLLSVEIYAQAPLISYPTPQTFPGGIPIKPLTPSNSGGGFPASQYKQVSTFVANFTGTNGLVSDGAGNFYVADVNAHSIDKVTANGTVTTVVHDSTTTYQIAVDPAGNLYFTDYTNNLVLKATPGGVVTVLAKNTHFHGPSGIALDAQGNLYVTDLNRVIKISPAGAVTTLAGNLTAGGADGTGTAATFNGPHALVVDNTGNVWVADYHTCAVREITPGGVVTTFSGYGESGANDGGPKVAQFRHLSGICLDENNNLYVSDG
ncbi:MAG TPA: hypothetical protein VHS53_12965, partial [Mucilaginibacter sp.]|nr:hypothetical protein [Mucilaginibacter sp.]